MNRIGGVLDYAALTGRDRHLPASREEMQNAVLEMAARGMTVYGIAAATRLSVEQVRRMLGEAQR